MKDYSDMLSTTMNKIGVQIKECKKEFIMTDKIKIKYENIQGTDTYKWSIDILDKNFDFSKKGCNIFSYDEGKFHSIIIHTNVRDKFIHKIYDSYNCISRDDLEELIKCINDITKQYYYVKVDNEVKIAKTLDEGLDRDRERKRLNNYFDTYEKAKIKYNKILEILKLLEGLEE